MILGGNITKGINALLHAGPYLVSVLTAIEEDREHERFETPDLCPSTQISASPYTLLERVLNAVDQVNQPQNFLARLPVVLDTLQNPSKSNIKRPGSSRRCLHAAARPQPVTRTASLLHASSAPDPLGVFACAAAASPLPAAESRSERRSGWPSVCIDP